MLNSGENDPAIGARLRTLRILWAVFLVTITQFALVAYLSDPLDEAQRAAASAAPPPGAGPSPLLYLFFALGLFSVTISFGVRQHFYGKAAHDARPEIVQTGFIIALVLCEVAALLGLLALFIVGNRYAYLLFILAALGEIFHFPRRDPLVAASRGGGGGGSVNRLQGV